MAGSRHLARDHRQSDLPSGQHGLAKAGRVRERSAVVEARSALPYPAW